MKQKNPKFFKRIKDAIFNFDEYKTFADEETSIAIKYLLKFILIFSLIISVALTIRVVDIVNKEKLNFKNNCPDFKFEDNQLIMETENNQYVNSYGQGYLGIIINSEKDTIENIEEANNYQRLIAFLKDKIVIKNADGIQNVISYKDLMQNYDLNNINKQSVLQYLSGKNIIISYVILFAIAIVYMFVIYLIQTIIDILLLSLIGFLLSRIVGIKLKYKVIFNLSVYSLTLSLILYLIYIVVNLFTGFNIIYFDIAYRAISYIYIITAILIIKSDIIKQNMELTKIIKVQKQVREENKTEEEPRDDKNDKEKEEKKKEENNNGQEPEGNQA